MNQLDFMTNLFKSLRITRFLLLSEFPNLIQDISEEETIKIVDKYPRQMFTEKAADDLIEPVRELAFSQGNNHLWADCFCLTQYNHIVRTLKNEDPFIGTPSIKAKCDKDRNFLIRLLISLFMQDLKEIESKNSDLTIFDIPFEGEMYMIKFTFLKKGTYDEIYYLDDLSQEVDIKIMTCLTSED